MSRTASMATLGRASSVNFIRHTATRSTVSPAVTTRSVAIYSTNSRNLIAHSFRDGRISRITDPAGRTLIRSERRGDIIHHYDYVGKPMGTTRVSGSEMRHYTEHGRYIGKDIIRADTVVRYDSFNRLLGRNMMRARRLDRSSDYEATIDQDEFLANSIDSYVKQIHFNDPKVTKAYVELRDIQEDCYEHRIPASCWKVSNYRAKFNLVVREVESERQP